MKITRIAAGVAAAAVAAALTACTPAATPNPDTVGATIDPHDPAVTEPMVVDGPSFSREVTPTGTNIRQWSVFCINPGASDLTHAAAWRQVQVSENGPDGPDGNWNKGRPCPTGPDHPVLAAS